MIWLLSGHCEEAGLQFWCVKFLESFECCRYHQAYWALANNITLWSKHGHFLTNSLNLQRQEVWPRVGSACRFSSAWTWIPAELKTIKTELRCVVKCRLSAFQWVWLFYQISQMFLFTLLQLLAFSDTDKGLFNPDETEDNGLENASNTTSRTHKQTHRHVTELLPPQQ